MTARGDPRHGHIGEAETVREEERAADKLRWLLTHKDPRFFYFLDQYSAARNLGLNPEEARKLAKEITEKFIPLPG